MPTIRANGLTLGYEAEGSLDDPAVLLIPGLSVPSIYWPDRLARLIADAGFHVVRIDNRDIGLSDKLTHLGVPDPLKGERAYLLSDMAADAAGLLSALGVANAHVAGHSMGGMIAQHLAALHPGRVRSLTSFGSRTRPNDPPAKPWAAVAISRRAENPDDRSEVIELGWSTRRMIGSRAFPTPDEELRDQIGREVDRGFAADGVVRQFAAIVAAGDFTHLARTITAPTLVLHGEEDPLILPACGELTARLIPNARLEIIDGLGHDIPAGAVDIMADQLIRHFKRH